MSGLKLTPLSSLVAVYRRVLLRGFVAMVVLLSGAAVLHAQDGSNQADGSQALPQSETSPALQNAIAAFRQGQFQIVLQHLEEARQDQPDLPVPRLMLARMFMEVGRIPQARNLLEELAVEREDDPWLYRTFGDLALQERRLTDASLHFSRVLELINDQAHSETFRKATRQHAYAGLAGVAEARQEWETARDYLLQALEPDPENVALRQRLGRALLFLDRVDEALAELERAARTNEQMEPPALTVARLYSQAGNKDEAEKWMQKSIEQHSERADVQAAYAAWLLERGKPQQAKEHVARAAELDPKSVEIKGLQGLIARYLEEYDRAQAIFEQLHHDHPADFGISNQLALTLIEFDDDVRRQRALQLAQVNARQYPQNAEALSTLGWISYRMGNLPQARQALQQAISAGQSSSDTAYFLARVLIDSDRKEDAKQLLSRALAGPGQFVYREEAEQWLKQLGGNVPQKSEPDETKK